MLKTVYSDSFADRGVTAMTLLSFILSATSGLRPDAVSGLLLAAVIIANGINLVVYSAKAPLGENGNENKAREKISKLTGADLFIKRR